MTTPQTVVFTQRAFNAIITETISKHPIETGGIFLGYVLDNGTWIVVENVPPGQDSTHRSAYFEYDADFVTYLSNVLANQYKGNLQILGLWHRHPGSMDVFSSTDDKTNRDYAADNIQGAISALVNCDPKWRLTVYHVTQSGEYHPAEWYVDDGDLIPEELLALRYTDADDVPTFDRRGVVRDRGDDTDKGDNAEAVTDDNGDGEKEGLNDCPASSSACGQRPYTVQEAYHDMKKIFRQLIRGTADDDN